MHTTPRSSGAGREVMEHVGFVCAVYHLVTNSYASVNSQAGHRERTGLIQMADICI